ncbi:MAG: glycerol-3-phosphate 1-O-acyltransferase PlsY [Proteobacteria bacterium]|nr:glycerol-3-phosphate 1-O-acyltransferase PlsY [Pseudomonadota bacterium]
MIPSFSSQQFLFLVLTYLIAAIPFGLLLSKILAKKDVRKHGSGNIGATNVARVLGKKLGLVTLILDGAKGAVMIIIARQIFSNVTNLHLFLIFVAAIAVIAHIFPIYIKFKGGKGVATTIAVLLALNPMVGLAAVISWIVIFLIGKISAVSSISSIVIATIFAVIYGATTPEIILYTFLAMLITVRHKENICRLLSGKENSFK